MESEEVKDNKIQSNNKIENSNTKSDFERKLKELTKVLFNQLKCGCHRKYCYNYYCLKRNGIIIF